MQRTSLLLAAGILLVSACKATPTLDGVPLTCSRDATCPEGLRCFAGGCITNSPPRIDPLGLRFVAPNTAFTATAVVSDAENDPVTLTWSQLYDTSVLAESLTGDTLTVTAGNDDTHVFEVVASDGYDASFAYLTLVVIDAPPAEGSVYVSDTGTDSADCGPPTAPCRTLATGLVRGGTIVLGATQRSTAYDHCLALGANESVWGGFDADTWRYDPVLIPRTEIACTLSEVDPINGAAGHVLAGSSVVGHVTLRLLAGETITTWPAAYISSAYLSGTSTLRGADVLAPAAWAPAFATGIVSDAAAGVLSGVEIRGDPGALDPPTNTTGIIVIGGELEMIAAERRGAVLINQPAIAGAYGIHNVGGTVTVDGIEIRGGAAAGLIGVIAQGGDTTVERSTIELRPFGTIDLAGIAALPSCEEPGCNPTQPTLTAIDNVIRIRGAIDAVVATCAGVGISHAGVAPGIADITGNTIEVDGDIGLAIGLDLVGGGNTVTGNTVTITRSLTLAGCPEYVVDEYPEAPTALGAVGAVLADASADTFTQNTITLEARAGEAVGIYARNTDGVLISDNSIAVAMGATPPASLFLSAVAAVLNNEDPGIDTSTFERNDLRVGRNAGAGTALLLRGFARWHVVNNTLYGGDTNYNTGLRSEAVGEDGWPVVAHNTIFGGSGLVSSAVRIGREPGEPIGEMVGQPGVVLNNLLDAGEGSARRFVLDNRRGGVDVIGVAQANLAQVASAPRSAPVASAALFTADLGGLLFQYGQLHLALPGSGSFATFEVYSGVDVANVTTLSMESWVPVGYAFDAVWVGNNDTTTVGPLAITAAPGRLSVSRLGESTFDSFVTYLLPDWGGTVLAPRLLALGEAEAGPPLDVVFVTDTQMWIAVGTGLAGDGFAYLTPEPGVTLTDPGFLERTSSDPDLQGADRFYIVDRADTAPSLVVWPTFDNSGDLVLPDVVTSFAVGPVGVTSMGGDLELRTVVAAVAFAPDRVPEVYDRVVYLTAPDGNAMAPQEVLFPADGGTCGGGSVTAVAILATGCGGFCNQVWVGCDDGSVQSFNIANSGSWELSSASWFTPSGSPGLPVAALSSNSHLIVRYLGSPEVTLFPPGAGGGARAVTITLLGDVGARGGTEQLYRDVADLSGVPGVDLGACNLALRDDPPSPRDLHLAAGPDDCDDAGTPLDGASDPYPDISVPQDTDGEPRTIDQPDVGADER